MRWAAIKMMRRGLGSYQNECEAGCMHAHNQAAKRHRGVWLMTYRLLVKRRGTEINQVSLARRHRRR
jgi:hypothetical protein